MKTKTNVHNRRQQEENRQKHRDGKKRKKRIEKFLERDTKKELV